MPDDAHREAVAEITEAIDHIESAIRWAAASEDYVGHIDTLADANEALAAVVYQIEEAAEDA